MDICFGTETKQELRDNHQEENAKQELRDNHKEEAAFVSMHASCIL